MDKFRLNNERWRVGRKLGRTIYAQHGSEPDDNDTLLGMMDDADVSDHICLAHNLLLKSLGIIDG